MKINTAGLKNKTILVTGAVGFIGANLVKRLLETVDGAQIVGVDSCNDYYDPALKDFRLEELEKAAAGSKSQWTFVKGNIADKALIEDLFQRYSFQVVVNLAAQAGVR